MHRPAVRIILDEHLAIGAVLYSLRQIVRRLGTAADPPEFRLLHAMLDYIVEYPDRWHHPKESRFLFEQLLKEHPPASRLVAALQAEHEQGVRLIDTLSASLSHFEQGVPGAQEAFVDAVEHYAAFQWAHIRKEEDRLLPLAERVLSDRAWQCIAQAFEENDNPLFGIKPRDDAARLFRAILDLAAPRGIAQPAPSR